MHPSLGVMSPELGFGLSCLRAQACVGGVYGVLVLVAEFTSPQKVYKFSFIVGNTIPKSVKCIHSATRIIRLIIIP